MNNIVIVGGGTAGWMAALAIASRYPEKRITVVDPKSISPMGVGESVTGVVFSFVNDPLHGLSKGDFFRHCDVTLKAGIWYKDWQGPGTEYLTPIDSPASYFKHFYPTSRIFMPLSPPRANGWEISSFIHTSCARGGPITIGTPTAA
jgi:hypothetical protein